MQAVSWFIIIFLYSSGSHKDRDLLGKEKKWNPVGRMQAHLIDRGSTICNRAVRKVINHRHKFHVFLVVNQGAGRWGNCDFAPILLPCIKACVIVGLWQQPFCSLGPNWRQQRAPKMKTANLQQGGHIVKTWNVSQWRHSICAPGNVGRQMGALASISNPPNSPAACCYALNQMVHTRVCQTWAM